MRDFLWEGVEEVEGVHLVNWEIVKSQRVMWTNNGANWKELGRLIMTFLVQAQV